MVAAADHSQVKETSNLVTYRVDQGVAILTLSDPPANTYTHEMMQTLDQRILAARMDEDVQVIVITGSERNSSAPAPTSRCLLTYAHFQVLLLPPRQRNALSSGANSKIVIAAINGHCVGGGLEVASPLTCALHVKGRVRWVCRKSPRCCRVPGARSVW